MPDPIAPKRYYGGEYGWVSPFILEVRNGLNLGKEQLPSRDAAIVPKIVEKAALGIMQEGKKLGESRAAEEMTQRLIKRKENGTKEVWKCCAHLYSRERFLYKTLNKDMRFIGSTKHEPIWRSKIHTLGPFGLLLWDNPFNEKPNTNKLVYLGANLTDDQIATYENLSKHTDEYGSFQAFTSCGRDPQKAESMGNVLLIIKVQLAFTVDL
ncbi:unnamed protein product [Rotaria magnacalcarata]|uniref:Uncharacterized protein n=2 Tax=Rotaria magnacalcarata TaxID=392030 RepID=A0A820GVW7_9BILA|nr:unnamed protein product [Rotaria magnacalcarata]CAF4286086.1 unnamed protein product [Rotaria magnacalcarata]CAF4295539.1 unnamed protein product [Rotaria magnacalcarata]